MLIPASLFLTIVFCSYGKNGEDGVVGFENSLKIRVLNFFDFEKKKYVFCTLHREKEKLTT
jgi:hypothetical protein